MEGGVRRHAGEPGVQQQRNGEGDTGTAVHRRALRQNVSDGIPHVPLPVS
jgi:hypothetical protein